VFVSDHAWLLFGPALGFGVLALTSSAVALGLGLGAAAGEEAGPRSGTAIGIAVVAALLCVVSLLIGGGVYVLHGLHIAGAND
jgi:hypothetical protein